MPDVGAWREALKHVLSLLPAQFDQAIDELAVKEQVTEKVTATWPFSASHQAAQEREVRGPNRADAARQPAVALRVHACGEVADLLAGVRSKEEVRDDSRIPTSLRAVASRAHQFVHGAETVHVLHERIGECRVEELHGDVVDLWLDARRARLRGEASGGHRGVRREDDDVGDAEGERGGDRRVQPHPPSMYQPFAPSGSLT